MESRRLTVFSFINALLASVMAVCFAVSFSRAVGVFEMDWFAVFLSAGERMMVFGFLVALEVNLSRRLILQTEVLGRDWVKRTLAEWTVLLVILLGLVWIQFGPRFQLRDLSALSSMTLEVVSRMEFFAGLALLVMVWVLSRILTADLTALENLPVSMEREFQRGLIEEQNSARLRIWQDVFLMGGCMVFLSVFALPIAHLVFGLEMRFGSIGLEVLLFFLCGLGLFVISRQMLLRAEWMTERTTVDASVPRWWTAYGLGFVLLLLLLAVVLPTEYSFRLLSSLGLITSALTTAFSAFALTVIVLITWLLSLVLPDIDMNGHQDLPVPEPAQQTEAVGLTAGIPWWTVLRELLFWGLVLTVLVYAVREILSWRHAVARRLFRRSWFRRLWRFFRRMHRRIGGWSRGLAEGVRVSLRAIRANLAGRGGRAPTAFLRLRRLDPRQMVRFYFFALLRREAERGIARRPAQTPREYAAELMEGEAPIAEELREMTLAFEEARYSRRAVGPEKAGRIRRIWDTVRGYLRSAKPAAAGGKR